MPTPHEPTRRKRRRPRLVDVSLATFLRALMVVALAWLWFRLWQWVLVFVLAAFLAVALDPLVQWLERRGLRRTFGALLTGLLLAAMIAGFIAAAGASIVEQTRTIGTEVMAFRDEMMRRVPPGLQQMASSSAPTSDSIRRFARAFAGGITGMVLALVLTVYLLSDGRRTCQWLIAFAPARHRPRVRATATEARQIVAAYIRGNLITSALCFVFTWIALTAMGVPAAFVLSLLAGVLDLVPVVGFIVSAAPAILLGLTVSPLVAIGVAAFYVLYNAVENYYIAPKVYGHELRLSDLAVIAAFLVGAELGGVLGAVVALPLAAMYPVVERLWLDRPGATDTADEHRRIAAKPEH